AACTVLLAMSVFSAWYPLTTPWQQPWLFKVMEMAGWIDYSDDPDFGPPFQTWIRTLPPTSGDEPSPCSIEFEGLTSVGEIERLRIEDATGADVDFPNADDPNIRLIRFTTTHIAASGAESVIANVLIALDAEAFQDGRPIDE